MMTDTAENKYLAQSDIHKFVDGSDCFLAAVHVVYITTRVVSAELPTQQAIPHRRRFPTCPFLRENGHN